MNRRSVLLLVGGIFAGCGGNEADAPQEQQGGDPDGRETVEPLPTPSDPPIQVDMTTETATAKGGGLTIESIHADAYGNDHENLDGEYIVFRNTGADELDLSDYRVEDQAGHTYYVPDGVTLAPGAQITLYTGEGANTESELYWGYDRAIWNNDGDTVFVFDDTGELVTQRSY